RAGERDAVDLDLEAAAGDEFPLQGQEAAAGQSQEVGQAADHKTSARLRDRLYLVDELGAGNESAAPPLVAQQADGAPARRVVGRVLLQRPLVGRPQRLSPGRQGDAFEALILADASPFTG